MSGREIVEHGRSRWFLLAVFTSVIAFVWVPTAGAQAIGPGDSPAVDQYSEIIPTSGGGTEPTSGGEGGGAPTSGSQQSAALSPSVAAELEREGGASAALLEKIATSPVYGAPQQPLEEGVGAEIGGESRSPVSAAVSAVSDEGSGARVLGLVVAMVLIGVAALAVTASRYRHRRA